LNTERGNQQKARQRSILTRGGPDVEILDLVGFQHLQSISDVGASATQVNRHIPVARAWNHDFRRKVRKKAAIIAVTLPAPVRIEV